MFFFGKRHSRWRRRACGPVGARARLRVMPAASAIYFFASQAHAEQIDLNPPQTFNQYGEVGLLDMPSARFNPDGEISATASVNPTMDRYNLGFQALPWLETVFRYSRIDRYLYSIGVPGDLYDRSLSLRVRLLQENGGWPAVAIGVQDILGTGAFGGEYIVATKKIGDFDVTAGIGWRRFGQVATFENPLALIFPSFKSSTKFGQQGTGIPLFSELFHGPQAGLIGGIEWQTPIDRLKLIAELSGDQFAVEQRVGAIKVRSPFNFGFSYEPVRGFQIGAGYLYGTQFGIRMTLHLNAFDDSSPQKFGTQPPIPNIRSEESRNQAELALLQEKTHFYDNWPANDLGSANSVKSIDEAVQGLEKPSTLADTLFNQDKLNGLEVEDVETYGQALILNVALKSRKISCGDFAQLFPAAYSSGLRQIVYSTDRKPEDITVCSTQTQSIAPSRKATGTAQELTNVAAADDSSPPTEKSWLDQLFGDASPEDAVADPIAKRIVKDATAQSIGIQSIGISSQQINVAFTNDKYRTDTEAIGRLVLVLMADAPDSIEQFHLIDMAGFVPVQDLLLHRSDIERISQMFGAADELLPTSEIRPASLDDPNIAADTLLKFPAFSESITPGYRQSLFDPDQPYRFQFYASLIGNVAFDTHLSFTAALEANIYSTISDITRQSNSELPHVRSDFAEYYKHGSNGISALTANYFTKLSPETYLYVRAGYLESMYAGVGAEVLWRPAHQRLALGAAIDAVQQRDFDRLFGLRHYQVITGHLSAYYDSPFYGLNFQVHAGRYLAGDWGATFQVTRRFASGVEIGVFATLTNVPFSVYGEGSFDKGFIVRIPIDFLAPVNTQQVSDLDFSPLTRDGGQRVAGEQSLYDTTRNASEQELLLNWDKVLNP